MNYDAYCPMCGQPRQPAPTCACGYIYAGGHVTIAGDKILGGSPIVLPCRCVKCGRDASDGRRFERTLYGYSPWILFSLFLGVLPLLVVYYATRRPLQIGYSTCAECTNSRKIRVGAAWGVWLAWLAVCVAAIVKSSPGLLVASVVMFFLALVASSLASSPLRVTGLKDGVFTVKGARTPFLEMLQGQPGHGGAA